MRLIKKATVLSGFLISSLAGSLQTQKVNTRIVDMNADAFVAAETGDMETSPAKSRASNIPSEAAAQQQEASIQSQMASLPQTFSNNESTTTQKITKSEVVTDRVLVLKNAEGIRWIAKKDVPFYLFPSADSPVLEKLALNTRIELTGTNGTGWFKAKAGELTGFVREDQFASEEISLYPNKVKRNAKGEVVSVIWDEPADYCQWDTAGFYDNSKWNGDWGNWMAGAYTVGESGCVIFSSANVVSTYTGQYINVGQLAQQAAREGYLNAGILGANTDAVDWVARRYGFLTKPLRSAREAAQALREGKCVVALNNASPFYWGGGHAVAYVGYNNNQTRVMDPNHPQRDVRNNIGGQWYDLDELWTYSQGPEMWVAMWQPK